VSGDQPVPSESEQETHNRRQRAYFENTVKKTMLPADTPYVRRQVSELMAFAELATGARVLEVGCGMGRYTFALRRAGLQVEGLDLSPVLIERLRAFAGSPSLPLHCADLAEPPTSLEGRFEAVVGFFVLHHVGALERCLAGAARTLAPGGRVVFLEPNPLNPLYYIQIALTPGMSWAGDGGIVRMTERRVGAAAAAAGLSGLAVRRFGFFPPGLANRSGVQGLERRLERVRLLQHVLPFQLFRAERS